MLKNTMAGLKVLILIFCILLAGSYCFAKDKVKDKVVDIAVTEINFPEKVYLKQKTKVNIVLANNSDLGVKDCMFTVEADDGSKVSQSIPLPRRSRQKVEMVWVPGRQGQINFKASLAPPKGIKAMNEENIQVTKTIEVLTP